MRKILILVILINLGSFPLFGQISFYKIFTNNGYDFGQGVVQLEDSSYVITGSSSSFTEGPSQAFLLKVDSLGNYLWSRHYGGNESDWGRRVLNWNDSIFYVTGHSNSLGSGSYNFFLIKTDENGEQLIEKHYEKSGWDKLNDAVLSTDSMIYMVGETTGTINGNSDFYVVKANQDGDTLWTKSFGSVGDDSFQSIKQLNDTTFYIVGKTFNADSTLTKAAVVKLHSNGQVLWIKEFGQNGHYELNDFFFDITFLRAVGTRVHPIDGDNDEYLLSIGLTGSFDFEYNVHSPGYVNYDNVCKYGSNDRIYIASYYRNDFSSGGSYDVGITRFTEDFNWDVAFVNIGFELEDRSGQIIPTSDGGAVSVGFVNGTDLGGSGIYIIKIGANDEFPVVDLNNISTLVSIPEMSDFANPISVFPNPSIGYFTVKTKVQTKLDVLDLSGKIVYHDKIIDESLISTINWEKGVYLLKFQTDEGATGIIKLIVQ